MTNELKDITPKYGALTGFKTAILPSNYEKMQRVERKKYYKSMEPYILMNNTHDIDACLQGKKGTFAYDPERL
jgi:hypothetical protein